MNDFERFDLVYDVGETMLENGAEIKRVELTIRHLADSLDLTNFDSFVMINGIFMTARCQNDIVQAKVKDVPISPISLGRIDAINTLSREIAAKVITPEEFKHRFEAVKQKSYATLRAKIFAYAFGSASFCFIFWFILGVSLRTNFGDRLSTLHPHFSTQIALIQNHCQYF